MSTTELPKNYDAATVEKPLYERWLDSGYFNPDNLPDGEPYTIIMPPPNANAPLHIGHALFITIEDILIRYQRMQGRKTLWLPGADHAGFETQVVFEKQLEKEGRSRFKMEREEFYKETWDFVQKNKHLSEEGIRELGASCDWSRNIFTLDPRIVSIVYETFAQMHKDDLVYRGDRICNWCTKHQTGLADLETTYEERIDPLYYIKYGPFELATVRPETKFGDTGIAVNPNDKRYQKYIGQEVEIETLLGPKKIKVIADEAVDPEFGTGVVKVTPAHDAVDFDMWTRHKDEIPGPVAVIDKFGRLNDKTGPYAGLKVAEARKKVVEDMQAKGLITKIDESYKHNVAVCYKCGTVIEPLIVPQWYVAMTKALPDGRPSLRDMAVNAVKTGGVKFVSEKFENLFMRWMENLRDWPISRQIWWGIPIPAWYCQGGHVTIATEQPTTCEQCSSADSVVFGTPHPDAQPRSSIIAYVENEEGKVLTLDWGEKFGGKLLVGGGLAEGEDPVQCARREIAEETGFTDLEHIETLPRTVTNNYFAHNKNVWRTATITPVHFKLKSPEHSAPKLEEAEKDKFQVEWADIDMLHKEIRDPAHAYVLRSFAGLPHTVVQDADTFDTWFSSGQWPYATLQAHGEKDFATYFPTQVMETGWDIIFFWVARMIMLSYYRTGKQPFQTVYLHGLVRDAKGQKISKSKGNVINPSDMIAKYGTDAVRMALIFSSAAGNDIPLAEDKIRGMKHFANKLWNIARFVLANVPNPETEPARPDAATDADRLILTKLDAAVTSITDGLNRFTLHEAAQTAYHFAWDDLADVYIEASKVQLADESQRENTQRVLLYVLCTALKLLHPFAPFVTEELWSKMFGEKPADLLMIQRWPSVVQ